MTEEKYYRLQHQAVLNDGLAQAFIIGEEFIGDDSCSPVLGDNIFLRSCDFSPKTEKCRQPRTQGATVFGLSRRWIRERVGVAEFDDEFRALSIEEKTGSSAEIQLGGFYRIVFLW